MGFDMTFYTKADVAEILSLTEEQTLALFSTKGFPLISIGGNCRIESERFKTWCKRNQDVIEEIKANN